MTPLALFVRFVRLNRQFDADDPVLAAVLEAYEADAREHPDAWQRECERSMAHD